MSSVVDICNVALSQVRSASINSLDDSNLQAQLCTLHYENARDQVLTDFDWGFNNTTQAMQLLTIRAFGWAYAWQYPNDCLKIVKVRRSDEDVNPDDGYVTGSRLYDHRFQHTPLSSGVDYQVRYEDQRVIVTNETDLYLTYRAKITDVSLYPVEVRMAISYLLASYIALPLVGVKDGLQIRSDCLALYNAVVTEAKVNAADQAKLAPVESEYITCRE